MRTVLQKIMLNVGARDVDCIGQNLVVGYAEAVKIFLCIASLIFKQTLVRHRIEGYGAAGFHAQNRLDIAVRQAAPVDGILIGADIVVAHDRAVLLRLEHLKCFLLLCGSAGAGSRIGGFRAFSAAACQ